MRPAIDLTGQRFGRLLVQTRAGSTARSGNAVWQCACDCGKAHRANSRDLRFGNVTSCGCYAVELLVARSRTHGQRGTRTYSSWQSMLQRCENHKSVVYKEYGGRGISVCARWHSFENFQSDMGDRPEGTSIDRIDGNGNYEPGNCRWATATDQSRNVKNNRYLVFNGMRLSLGEWAGRVGLSYEVLYDRLRYGWDIDAALTTPIHQEKSRRANVKGSA